MTLQFLNLDTLHQRLRIHSYVTGCTTERVWGGGGGLLIIAFSSWPRLLVLSMCIVRLYLKTFSNHQTVFIFTFASMKFSDNLTGAFNRKLTCWGHQIGGQGLVSLKRPVLYFVIRRNNTTEKVFVCTIFIFPVHDTILSFVPREGHAPKNPGIENFKPHKIRRSPPSPEISSSRERAWIRSNKGFSFSRELKHFIIATNHRVYTVPWLQRSVLEIHLGWNNLAHGNFRN